MQLKPSPRLSWSKITELFAGEWIELVDYEWPWGSIAPTWGKVRNNAEFRQDLIKKIGTSSAVEESIVLFIGPQLKMPHLEISQATASE